MSLGLINKIIPFSSVDGPGNRMAIFLQECNLNCAYCHNPETINECINCGQCVTICPVNALTMENGRVFWNEDVCVNCDKCIEICQFDSTPKTKLMSVESIIKQMLPIKDFITGVTVSGGECTLQKDFLIELGKEIKKLNKTIFIDTNGCTDFEKEQELFNSFDMALLDVKSFDLAEHIKLTGSSNELTLQSLHFLAKNKKLYEIRIVIVPEILDNERNVREISKIIAKYSTKIRFKLIKYRPLGVRNELIQSYIPNDEMMKNLQEIAENNGCENVIIV